MIEKKNIREADRKPIYSLEIFVISQKVLTTSTLIISLKALKYPFL